MIRGQTVLMGLFGVAALVSLLPKPASAAVVDIYGSYTSGVSNVTPGDNAPTIDLSGGLKNTKYFNVDDLVEGGPAKYAVNDPNGLLFTVVPATCITGHSYGCQNNTGTETATISVDFTFYDSHGTAIGTASDKAIATFNYFSNPNNDSDNLCWMDNAVSGTAVVSHQLVGTCGAPGTGLQTAYEQIEVALNGNYYGVNLYDWNDWDEKPKITFQWLNPPTQTPEPSTLAILAASLLSLAGWAFLRRRRTTADAV